MTANNKKIIAEAKKVLNIEIITLEKFKNEQ